MGISALAIQYPITRFNVQVRLKKVVTQELGMTFWKLSHPLVGSKLHTDTHTHTLNTSTNQHPITTRRFPHMGTKLPSSNWSAEKIGKLLTSAGILYTRTNTRTHARTVTQGQSVQRSLGNMESSILSFIHLSIPQFIAHFRLHRSHYRNQRAPTPPPPNSSGTSGVQLP